MCNTTPPQLDQEEVKVTVTGAGNTTAVKGSMSIGGNVNHSILIITETVRVALKEGGWEIFGGDQPLSTSEGAQQTLDDAQRALQPPAASIAYSGPTFLDALLKNYEAYYRRWQEAGTDDDTAHITLRCFNQEDVMRKIRFASSARVIELSGPSGIGKSHVLQALREEQDRERLGIPDENWGKWKYVYLRPRGSFDEIMSDLIGELGNGKPPSRPSIELLAQRIMRIVQQDGVRHVLFVLDSVDNLDKDTLIRLVGNEGPVGARARAALPFAPDVALRLVVTTKRPQLSQALLRQHEIWNVLRVQMDALEFEYVRDMLLEHIRQSLAMTPGEDVINVMARQIYEIGGGHPGAVSVILRELADRSFAVDPQEFPARFGPLVLRIIQRDIIGDLSVNEYLLLNVLSAFRYFHVGIIEQLIERGLLPDNLLGDGKPTQTTTWLWLVDLSESPALIRRNSVDSARPFSVHPVLRHVLPMDLNARNPQHLYTLHFEAFKIHDSGLRERDASNIRLRMPLPTRPVCTMEAMYHAVNCHHASLASDIGPGVDPPDLLALAEEYCRLYADSYLGEDGGFTRGPFDLSDRWEQDSELQELVRRLPDGTRLHQGLQQIFGRDPDQV